MLKFLAFHINSRIATNSEKDRPPRRTTKTPPTLSILRGITEDEPFFSSWHWPPPFFCFHQRSFSMRRAPLSCNWRIACDKGIRYMESEFAKSETVVDICRTERRLNTFSRCDSITFAVEKSSDLSQIAIPFDDILNGSAFPAVNRNTWLALIITGKRLAAIFSLSLLAGN